MLSRQNEILQNFARKLLYSHIGLWRNGLAVMTVSVCALTAYSQQDYSELSSNIAAIFMNVQFKPRHATPRHATPRHKFSYKNLSSETRPIPQYTVCFTYIIRHEPCSNSLRRFNYLSGISIFTSQLVWDTRLPLVECGRACHAPAIILVHPIHSPTTTVVIHPVSIPSNPSALFCKPDEWLWSMADIAE